MNSTRSHLIAYGLHLMRQVTGIEPAGRTQPGDMKWVEDFERLLGTAWPEPEPDAPLTSIFSRVHLPEQDQEDTRTAKTAYLEPASLEMKGETLFPRHEPPGDFAAAKLSVGQEFQRAYTSLRRTAGADDPRFFTAFYHLMERFAWALPNTYGEPGVSLFQQWKAVAALAFASGGVEEGPAENFALVGGDIPGIQDFVYTITSKGAAKGLRGRSFFLQLLGDAVVRRLVRDLELCQANVIYAAGGNFVLLAPAGSEAALQKWQRNFNRALLDEFEGDLYLALAWEELPQMAVGTPEFAAVREQLGARIAVAKSRRFAQVVEKDGWEALFQPQGRGGLDYCQVCQREPRPGEKLVPETTEAGETVKKCSQCRSFEALARDIAHDSLWMIVTKTDEAVRREKGWRGTLARLTGFTYRFEHDLSRVDGSGTVLALNDTDLAKTCAHGFRFVANVTPRIEETDRKWVRERHPDLKVSPGDSIKDFALMALQSEGISRVGVLRMDVDNLGAIFGQYLRGSLAQTSALSAALDLFFAGHLNRICDEVSAQGEHENVIYVIYAGGDDLFVVGSWDRMPELAERVRKDFAAYTGGNPHLTLSGGVTLEGRKFPLYRAAERAGEAEGKAKRHTRPDGHEKDAFCFLGQVVGWGEEWELVRETEQLLSDLVGAGVPHSLLRVTQVLHAQFAAERRRGLRIERETGQKPTPDHLYWGRWVWMAAYSLTRLARGCPKEQKEEILRIQREWIESGKRIHFLGLTARWAEYKLRGGER